MGEHEEREEEFDFDPEIDGEEAIIKYEEVEGICKRHIEEGHDPYTEDQFHKIYQWMEETRFNDVILQMVLDGKLDIVFDEEKLEELDDENGLLFALTQQAKDEVERMGIKPPDPNSIGLMNNIRFTKDGE